VPGVMQRGHDLVADQPATAHYDDPHCVSFRFVASLRREASVGLAQLVRKAGDVRRHGDPQMCGVDAQV
jgi:hypothetical protein